MKKTVTMSLVSLALAITGSAAYGYPVDPSKVPVADVDITGMEKSFTLAYDSADKSIVYYSPKSGRVATINGMPLVGFAVLPTGAGILNVQFDFDAYGSERTKLLNAIKSAGYAARPMPYVSTVVKPMVGSFDEQSRKQICTKSVDESTGQAVEDCGSEYYDKISYAKGGPTLGENIGISVSLNRSGAAIYKQLLRSGNALQMMMEAEYYTAGDAFTATVTVKWEKLLESFNAYAAYHDGICTDVEIETFFKKEGVCYGKDPAQCFVRVDLKDGRGRAIDNVTLDPESPEMNLVWQAVERLKTQFQDEMLVPLAPEVGRADTSKPRFGFKLSAKYEKNIRQKNATIEFKSPRGVNKARTTLVAGVGCIKIDEEGDVSRLYKGDCQGYWEGTKTFQDVAGLR